MSRSKTGEGAILRLVERIYQTVDDQVEWPTVLAEISDSVAGGTAALLYHDVRLHNGGLNQTARLSPEAIDIYQRHFHKLDPWGKGTGTLGLGKTGAVLNGDQLIALPHLRRTEYYEDYASKYDLVRILAGVVIADGPVLSVISILRAENAKPFGREEQQQLAILMPHLKRVLEMRQRVEGLQLLNQASSNALDRLPTGVILVDAAGRVVFANTAAEAILSAGDGLTVDACRLTALRASDTVSLRGLIAAAARTTGGQSVHPGGVMALARPNHARPLSVMVAPVFGAASYAGRDQVAAAVFVSNPDQPQSPDPDVLRALFGLTGAECRLTVAMCAGLSLAEAAGSLGITRETAKSYLKQAFAKTGTSRQSELVAVVSRLGSFPPAGTKRR